MFATRFAPSPTGPLHLGHAYSAVMAHAAVHDAGGQFRLRIDDIDQGRARAEWRQGIVDDLGWLGLGVDGPVIVQSARMALYAAARDMLRETGVLYPCFCTRAEIAAEIAASASAPHGADGPLYPGTCRHRDAGEVAERLAAGEVAAWRLDVAQAAHRAGPLVWQDATAGDVTADPLSTGDVVLWRRDGGPAYHLATVVDDADMAISLVVRGADLFAATHVHRLLQALLVLPTPAFMHHRLVASADGRRLAKRDDAASLASLRAARIDGAALSRDLRDGRLPPPYGWTG
jgi:glutamyl-Q tRNA(Asp) synthetase